MTAAEFKIVVALAKGPSADFPLTDEDYKESAFADGWGLPEFEPKGVSLKCAVAHLRWQCCGIFGGWDDRACAEAWYCWVKRRRFELTDLTQPQVRSLVAQAVAGALEGGAS